MCKECGRCCERAMIILITEYEKNIIKEYIEKHKIKKADRKRMRLPFERCKFQADGKCIIHDVKPSMCKEFDCTESKKIKPNADRKYNLDFV